MSSRFLYRSGLSENVGNVIARSLFDKSHPLSISEYINTACYSPKDKIIKKIIIRYRFIV